MASGVLTLYPAQATEWVDKHPVDVASEAGFAPHKALYDIDLISTRSGSQIINIDGQMFYDWQPGCDAWNSKHRFNLFYEYADSPPIRITSDFSTFETFDGKSMSFTSQRKRDGQVFEELRGHASIEGGDGGEAVYSIPKGLVFDLPQGSLFPMGHTLGVLSKIKSGKKLFNEAIFDGSDEEGPVAVNAFVGKVVDVKDVFKASQDFDVSLVENKAWRVRLAFFPLNKPSETSDYEMAITFHENGVISDMIIEYDDFTISQKLVAIEALEGTCDDGKAGGVKDHE